MASSWINSSNLTSDIFKALSISLEVGSLGLIKLAFPSISNDTIKILQNEFLDIYENNLCKKTVIFEPLDELLNYLEIYNIKWGIVTNKPCRMTLKLLHKLNLDCPYVISGDTLGTRKPNPKPLYIACELMNIKSEDAIYVGDACRDIKAGNDANMTTITCAVLPIGLTSFSLNFIALPLLAYTMNFSNVFHFA